MKATEHFDLPLEASQEGVYQSDGTDEAVAEFNTPEQAQIAARAINHADKLEDCLHNLVQVAALSNLCHLPAYQEAKKALAAYRSAK